MFLFYTCPEPKPGKCPVINEGSFGTCDEGCTTDHDCEGNAKCCSNGCGSVCGKCLECQWEGGFIVDRNVIQIMIVNAMLTAALIDAVQFVVSA